MGSCFSSIARDARDASVADCTSQTCELQRLPPQVIAAHILSQLGQRELFSTVPLVCKEWYHLSKHAGQALSLDLSSASRQLQLPQLLRWLQRNGQHLQQLQLSSSTALGHVSRRALLSCLAQQHGASSSSSNSHPQRPALLSLQQLALQMDLDVLDLAFLACDLVRVAPALQTLKLQPLKPSLSDLQLLVLTCILGNLVGSETAGPVLPHLRDCSTAVRYLSSSMTQLRHLSLSRYNIESTACISGASQLTALTLQHCGLTDAGLQGLPPRLQRLVLADNLITTASLGQLQPLQDTLQHLDLSVMPSISRMRSSSQADISALGKLRCLRELNIIGLGVADANCLSGLTTLTLLEAGLNPLSAGSLQVIGGLQLRHLELGGISQAWVLSSLLPAPEALRAHDHCWYKLRGMEQVTSLDLGGSNFSAALWTDHISSTLALMPQLRQLTLAHCHIPAGHLLLLLPQLTRLQDLTLDRCAVRDDEVAVLPRLPSLIKLSAVCLVPKIGNKQAQLLAQSPSLRTLVLRNNDVGVRGAYALARMACLTSLDLTDNSKVNKRCQRQLAPLLRAADSAAADGDDNKCW